MFEELQNSGGYVLKALDLLRAKLCDNEAIHKETGHRNPASSSFTTKARNHQSVWKHYQAAWKQQKSYTENWTSPIAGERQLSERPCVVQVSFCQITASEQSPSRLESLLLWSPASSIQWAHGEIPKHSQKGSLRENAG